MELPNWLLRQAQVRPAELALIATGQRLTWAELAAQADATARRLAGLGVGHGDRVALLLANGADFVLLVHALTRLGAELVPLNTRLSPHEIAWQLEDSGARLLLHDAKHALIAAEAAQALPNLKSLANDELAALPEHADTVLRAQIDLDAIHCIVYTSGTTGQPKGALITYGNEWWSAVGSALNLGNFPTDRWLAILPLFHVGGMAIIVRSAVYGVAAIVQDGFDAAAANRAIDDEGATIVSVVANMLGRMLDERGEKPYPPALRCMLLGGGPAPLPLLERCARLGVPVVQTYGLTEAASQVATLAPADALRKLGSAGQSLLPTELWIERDGQPVGPGEEGEIVLRGPTVSPGYLNRPDETARALRGGWLHSGDLGRLDGEGYLYVLDRRDDLIISGGENVYPAEIEAVLLAHPAVAEAGVIGAPDPRWGQAPVAFVRAVDDALDANTLIAYCRERMASYKVPARIIFVADLLPRNAAGKLLRRELRRLV